MGFFEKLSPGLKRSRGAVEVIVGTVGEAPASVESYIFQSASSVEGWAFGHSVWFTFVKFYHETLPNSVEEPLNQINNAETPVMSPSFHLCAAPSARSCLGWCQGRNAALMECQVGAAMRAEVRHRTSLGETITVLLLHLHLHPAPQVQIKAQDRCMDPRALQLPPKLSRQ